MTETRGPSQPSRYAHEVVPRPPDECSLHDATRYEVARAIGLWRRFMSGELDDARRYLIEACYSGLYALTLVALLDGLSGGDAYSWAWERAQAENLGEWLWDSGQRLGIDVDDIRAYAHEDDAKDQP